MLCVAGINGTWQDSQVTLSLYSWNVLYRLDQMMCKSQDMLKPDSDTTGGWGGGPLLMLGRLRLSPHLCSAALNAATGWLRVALRREIIYWGIRLISEKKKENKHDRQYDFWSMSCSQSDYCGPVSCAKRTMRRCPGSEKREPMRSFQCGPGPGDENHR